MNSESQGFGCEGYGVDRNGECAQLPCIRSPEEGTGELHRENQSSTTGQWLHSLTFEIPHVTEWGPIVNIDRGKCSHLHIGDMEAISVGTAAVPEIDYRISGIRLQCRLNLRSNTLQVNFGFANSEVTIRVAIQPYETPQEDFPLPLGPVSMTYCSVIGRLSYLDFKGTGLLEPELRLLRANIMAVVEKDGSYLACSQLRPLISERATLVLAHFASALAPLLNLRPVLAAPAPLVELVDWATYPPLRLLGTLLSERRAMMTDISRRLSPLMFPVSYNISRRTGAMVTDILINAVGFGGLDSLVDDGVVVNGTGHWVDVAASFDHIRLIISAQVHIDLAANELKLVAKKPLIKNFNVSIDVRNASVGLRMLAMLSWPALDELHVDQLQQPSCLAACAEKATAPPNAPIAVEQVMLGRTDMNVSDSAALTVSTEGWMEADVADAIDVTTGALLRGYLPTVEAMLPGALQFVRPRVDDAVQLYMEHLPPCKPTTTYEGPGGTVTSVLLWGAATAALAAALSGICRAGRAAATAGKPRPPFAHSRGGRDNSSDEEALGCESEGGPLADSPVVPQNASAIFLLMLFSTLLLFLYADTGLGTVINVVVSAGDHAVTVGPAFAFSLVSCALSAWAAKAYVIAALILGLSGVWPILKLVLLLFAWVTPQSHLSVKARERLLTFLDSYGKYSLIDSWLAILALATYRIGWQSEATDVSIFVDPVPMLAFFAFVVATVMSLVLGHAASELHRLDVRLMSMSSSDPAEPNVRSSLRLHAPGDVQVAVTVSLLGSTALIIVGALVTSFHVTTSGVLTTLMLDPPDLVRPYSLVGLGVGVTEGKDGDAWLLLVQGIFVAFTLVIPLALNTVLLLLWQLPMRRRVQSKVLHLCKMLDAWASFDVFVLALLVSHFEFGRMATFLVYHDNMSTLCGWVQEKLQDDCFHIECIVSPGFIVLVIAGLASYAVPKAACGACSAAMAKHLERQGLLQDRSDSDEGWSSGLLAQEDKSFEDTSDSSGE